MKKLWRLWRLWIALVLASIAWQPFRLGFYADDWNAVVASRWMGDPFTWTRFAWVNQVDPHRPSLGPLRWVFSSLLSDSAPAWHVVLLGVGVLVAWLLGRAAWALTSSPDEFRGRGLIYGIAATWLVIPWAIAFRIWPLFLAVQIMLACFAHAIYLVFKGWREGKPRILVPALLYWIACLGYEACNFQFVPIVLMGLLLARAGKVPMRHVLASSVGLAAAQALSLGWILLASVLDTWSRKSVQPGWLALLGRNIRALVPEILHSLSGARMGFLVSVAALGVLTGVTLWKAGNLSATRSYTVTTLGQVACCALGALLSLVIFAMGLRPVIGVGVETRVLSLLSFWSVLGVCILGACLWRTSAGILRLANAMAAVSLGLCLVRGNYLRAQEWSEAWARQQQVLNDAPVPEMLTAQPGASVIYVHPREVNGAPIFSSPWDINTAMPLRYPGTERLRFIVYSYWLGPLVWDGNDLKYVDLGEVERAPVLYVWRPGERSFYRATRPFRVNQDLSMSEIPLLIH